MRKDAIISGLMSLKNIAIPVTSKVCKSYLTVDDLMKQWLNHTKRNIKHSTYIKYDNLIKNHIVPEIGTVLLKNIKRRTLDDFVQNCMVNGHVNGGPLSRKTVNDILTVVSLAFKFAEEEYQAELPKIKYLKELKREARVLSIKEQSALTQYLIENIDIFNFGILLTLHTGLRVGELCALRWEDITDVYINVSKTMQRLKGQYGKTEIIIGEPKSLSSKRKIPIPDYILPYIRQFRKESGYVLCTGKKEYAEPRCMQMKFGIAAEKAGLENVSFHTLRHTFATRCIEAGFDVKTLSEILGHSDVKTTLNRYVHSSFEFKQENMEKLTFIL